MSQVLALLGFIVLLDGLRVRALTAAVAERRVVLLGIGAAASISALLIPMSRPLIDYLSVSAPTFWVAAGIVMTAAGVVGVVRIPSRPWALDASIRAAMVPLVFPILLTPALVAHSLASGLEYRLGSVIAILFAAGLAVVTSATSFPPEKLAPVLRMQGAFTTLLGVVWLVEGTRGLLL
ncbi:MAG: hypothetical protein ACC652_03275 [Acidimicrobiales bacterium]